MLHLLKLFILLCVTTVSLNSTELEGYKNNFYILFDKTTENFFETNLEDTSFKKNNYLYSLGYLRQFDDFYLGVSLKFPQNDKIRYLITLEDNNKVEIQKEKYLQVSLQIKYNVFEFENIKFLLGVDFGYQLNNLSLNYKANRSEIIKDEYKRELDIGDVIDDDLWNTCNIGIIGDNIALDPITEKHTIIGDGVYCYGYINSEKKISYDTNTELMKITLPITLNFTTLYGLTNNIDLGLGIGLTIIENLNINYTDNFIKLNNQQSFSYYSINFLINYKIKNK